MGETFISTNSIVFLYRFFVGIKCVRAVARVLKGGFDQIFLLGALLDPSQIQLGGLGELESGFT